MATVECFINTSPADVFAVLANGWTYSNWVVGTSHMRAVAADWPAVGSKLHHASGVWPVVLRDETMVEEAEPPQRLKLTARGRPFGEVTILLELEPDGAGTRVRMTETPVSGPGKWAHNPAADAMLKRRNTEALARLTALVEQHTSPAE